MSRAYGQNYDSDPARWVYPEVNPTRWDYPVVPEVALPHPAELVLPEIRAEWEVKLAQAFDLDWHRDMLSGNSWSKPQLQILPSATIILGYTNLGPTIQLTASLSTDRRNALIERVELEISHELGEKRHLTWVSVSEFGQQITAPTGEVINFGRNEPATAIKVTTDTLTPRQILLQDSPFIEKSRTLGEEVQEHYRYLKTKDEAPMKALFESKEARPAREYFERSFYWKPGQYTFEILLNLTSPKDKHVQKFEVRLSTADSDRLASNCKLFEEYVTAEILNVEGVPSKYPAWKWVQTQITPMRG